MELAEVAAVLLEVPDAQEQRERGAGEEEEVEVGRERVHDQAAAEERDAVGAVEAVPLPGVGRERDERADEAERADETTALTRLGEDLSEGAERGEGDHDEDGQDAQEVGDVEGDVHRLTSALALAWALRAARANSSSWSRVRPAASDIGKREAVACSR